MQNQNTWGMGGTRTPSNSLRKGNPHLGHTGTTSALDWVIYEPSFHLERAIGIEPTTASLEG